MIVGSAEIEPRQCGWAPVRFKPWTGSQARVIIIPGPCKLGQYLGEACVFVPTPTIMVLVFESSRRWGYKEVKDLLEHIREVGLAQREGIMIDQGWDRWEMISLIFMSRFKLIVHRDRDIFGLVGLDWNDQRRCSPHPRGYSTRPYSSSRWKWPLGAFLNFSSSMKSKVELIAAQMVSLGVLELLNLPRNW